MAFNPNADAYAPSASGTSNVIRWGIASAGKISNDFCLAMQAVPNSKLVAVAARDLDRAHKFAKEHNIPAAYGMYDQLARDPNVDIVYVGSTNNTHFEISKLMLENGKHVLCEKPMVISVAQTKALIEVAKKHKKFLMEGIWSRFFPAYEKLKEELRKGTVGQPRLLQAHYCVSIAEVDRIKHKELYGGIVYDLAIYALQLALWIYEAAPVKVQALGNLNDEGMPIAVAVTLQFPGGGIAQLTASGEFEGSPPSHAWVTGTVKGDIRVNDPFNAPTELVVNGKGIKFDLPKIKHGMDKFNFANNMVGLSYQAAAVAEYVRKGKLESEEVPHSDSLLLAQLIEDVHKQLGVTFQ